MNGMAYITALFDRQMTGKWPIFLPEIIKT